MTATRDLARTESPEAELARYRETGDRRARNAVVDAHRWLAVAIAREYHTGGEPLDDLVQVACMALVKAAERFDPTFGVVVQLIVAACMGTLYYATGRRAAQPLSLAAVDVAQG